VLTLARRKGFEILDGLQILEPAMPELEVTWVTQERVNGRK
jgi:hypothetical protein